MCADMSCYSRDDVFVDHRDATYWVVAIALEERTLCFQQPCQPFRCIWQTVGWKMYQERSDTFLSPVAEQWGNLLDDPDCCCPVDGHPPLVLSRGKVVSLIDRDTHKISHALDNIPIGHGKLDGCYPTATRTEVCLAVKQACEPVTVRRRKCYRRRLTPRHSLLFATSGVKS